MKRAYAIRRSRAAGWAKLCGGLALPVLVLGAAGARTGIVPAPALLPVLVLGFLLGLVALCIAAFALLDIWRNGADGATTAVAGIIYALPALALLGVIGAAAVVYPRLTDVTTNADDPPEFVLRSAPQGPPEGETLARQREAYPDLETRLYPLPLGEVYPAVRSVIEGRGWDIVRDSKPEMMPVSPPEPVGPEVSETEEIIRSLALKTVVTQSRGVTNERTEEAATSAELRQAAGSVALLEATARTPLFGFRDDVVIRMRATPEGTEVDMRSASEIGEHDLGQNARRIRSFFGKLDSVLLPDPGGGRGIASAGR